MFLQLIAFLQLSVVFLLRSLHSDLHQTDVAFQVAQLGIALTHGVGAQANRVLQSLLLAEFGLVDRPEGLETLFEVDDAVDHHLVVGFDVGDESFLLRFLVGDRLLEVGDLVVEFLGPVRYALQVVLLLHLQLRVLVLDPADVAHLVVRHLVLGARPTHRVRAQSAVVSAVFQTERDLADVAGLLVLPSGLVRLEVVLYVGCLLVAVYLVQLQGRVFDQT